MIIKTKILFFLIMCVASCSSLRNKSTLSLKETFTIAVVHDVSVYDYRSLPKVIKIGNKKAIDVKKAWGKTIKKVFVEKFYDKNITMNYTNGDYIVFITTGVDNEGAFEHIRVYLNPNYPQKWKKDWRKVVAGVYIRRPDEALLSLDSNDLLTVKTHDKNWKPEMATDQVYEKLLKALKKL